MFVTNICIRNSIEPYLCTFLKDITLTFRFYDLDGSLYPLVQTTNALERLFREFRTKSDEIGAFPNEDSCLTIFSWFDSVTMQSMTVSNLWRKLWDTNDKCYGKNSFYYGRATSGVS
jgi:transposase-like protein